MLGMDGDRSAIVEAFKDGCEFTHFNLQSKLNFKFKLFLLLLILRVLFLRVEDFNLLSRVSKSLRRPLPTILKSALALPFLLLKLCKLIFLFAGNI